jgi:choline dehydrogenase-like flavoprotein
MIEDFRQYPDNTTFEADVCIIGAGPGGISLANEFVGTGWTVLLVESGGLKIEDNVQELSHGESVGLPHLGHRTGRVRAFGGTAKAWAGQCLRLDPIDFEERDWVSHSGWPISLGDLQPYYDRAEKFFEISGQSYGEEIYRRLGLEPPLWMTDTLETRFTVYTPNVDTGKFFQLRFRGSKNIKTLLHANVVQIETNEAATVALSVRIRSLNGNTGRIAARAIVLAAGGIENARLLLASTERNPNGLGNDRDLVGRYFQEHPNGGTATLTGFDVRALQRQFCISRKDGIRYFPKFALSPAAQRRHEVLNCNAHLFFHYAEDSGRQALRAFRQAIRDRRVPKQPLKHLVTLARNYKEVATLLTRASGGQEVSDRVVAVRLQCYLEQAPNRESRVVLSREKDALGMRRVQMKWQMKDMELRTLRVMTNLVASEFSRLKSAEVKPDEWLTSGAGWQQRLTDCAHHMGTTRMGTSPDTAVTDANCEIFDVRNLFVCGSSLFPTSGYANPTLTIVALANRLAETLKRRLQRIGSNWEAARLLVRLPCA